MRLPLLALPVLLTAGCMVDAIDPIELVRTDLRADLDRPELAVLPDGTVQQRYVVLLRDDVVQAGLLDDTVVDLVLGEDVALERVYRTALAGFAAPLSDAQVRALRARPEVLLVDEDRRVEASRGGPPAPPPPPAVDWAITDVLAGNYTGDLANTTDGAGATVAVLDTGIDTNHPYLPAATCLGNFTGGSGCEDGNGHGTHVSGTIAAKPSTGHRGIAPGVALSVAKVLSDSGSGSTSGIAAAIDTAAAAGIDVLNMSLGGSMAIGGEAGDALCIAINNANALGTASVVAAGNESSDTSRTSPGGCDGAITVAAYDSSGRLASFTNYGADVDIAAPGVSIYSTTNDGAFGTKNGTSMASPHATAVAALVVAANPSATPADVKATLIANSSDRGAPTNYSRKISLSGVWKLDGRDY